MKRCLVCLGLALLGASACTTKTFGNGIGRPPVTPVDRPSLVPVTLAEIYAAGDPSGHYADLLTTADAALDLDGYRLCDSRNAAADTCLALSGTLDPGVRRRVVLTSLDLLATAGELGLVGADDVVHAYVAWGADPSTLGSTVAAAATVSGATTAGAFITLPYPMPTTLGVTPLGDGQHCVPSHDVATPAAPEACPTVAPALALTEVLSRFGDTGDSWVEVLNAGPDALPLYGVRLCQLPSCLVFAREDVIGAASRLLVHFGVEAPSDPPPPGERFYPGLPALQRSSEVALFAPGAAQPTDGTSLMGFVRFGAAPSELSTIAAGAGFWPEPFATAKAVRVAGESLSHDLSADRTETAWHPATPTPLAENLDIREGTGLWDSCSFPRPWLDATAFGLAIHRVSRADPPGIDLWNRNGDGTAVALTDLSLELNGQTFPLAACGEVAAGDLLGVRLVAGTDPPSCTDGELHVTGASLDASGEVALVDGTLAVKHYLRWGDSTPAGATEAVDAGVWPLERCSLPALDAAGEWTLQSGQSGHAPPDYQ